MTEPVHWFAAFGFVCLAGSLFVLSRSTIMFRDAIAETQRTARYLEVLREAVALIKYGAVEEAMDVIDEALEDNIDRG